MLFYNLIVRSYHAVVSFASLFNNKAKLFTKGRRNVLERLKAEKAKTGKPLIWFHCASLGEFEQGRPLIEQVKKEFPAYGILLTFFSPSGFEIRRNYEYADLVFYLPADTPANAEKFLEIVQPKIALFVKYEFWLNYLSALKKKKIPFFLVSGIFRPDQHFFKWYGKNFRESLHAYSHLFLQNQESLQLLQQQGIKNCSVAGDTRFDRVYELSQHPQHTAAFSVYAENSFVLVAGSTWPEDEKRLLPAFEKLKKEHAQLKLIIAPHQVDEKSVAGLISTIQNIAADLKAVRFTENKNDFGDADIVIVDTIGMLSSLYQYGQLAYIGGGFGSGIHNILEPMAFGLPVIFGPDHKKFNEALEAIADGTGFSFTEKEQPGVLLAKFLNDKKYLETASAKAKSYIRSHAGSTQKIMHYLRNLL